MIPNRVGGVQDSRSETTTESSMEATGRREEHAATLPPYWRQDESVCGVSLNTDAETHHQPL